MDASIYEIEPSKKEEVFAFVYWVILLAWTNAMVYLLKNTSLPTILLSKVGNQQVTEFLLGIFSFFPMLVPMIIWLKATDQKGPSIGLERSKLKESFSLGLKACTLVLLINIFKIPVVIESILGQKYGNPVLFVLYYLVIVSATEELIFRGFIQSRIKGLIRQKFIRTFFVGFAFAMLHIPMHIKDIFAFVSIYNICLYIIIHFCLVYLHEKYDNILAPIMVHALWNIIMMLSCK